MNKLLPKTKYNQEGFTLVELMVVISIIAILAIIGITVFQNVQKNARDSRRRADVDSIAAAMETNYNEGSGLYNGLTDSMFSSGKAPLDPLNTQSTCNGGSMCMYCSVAAGATVCPNSGGTVVVGTGTLAPAAGATYKVCTNLEIVQGSVTSYCRANQR